MEAVGGTVTATCPECGATIPVDPHYVRWCDACDWNVDPAASTGSLTKEARRKQRARERDVRRAARLHEEMLRRGVEERGVDAGRALSYLLAVAVILVPVALFGFGVFIATASGFGPGGDVLGAALVAVAVVARPRFGQRNKRATPVRRDDAPAFFALVDRIAAALSARPPAHVVVDGQFNAGTRFVDLRRRVELIVGMPLWAMLDDEQRIAVLGHEIAHQVNGDTQHGLLVGAAMNTLVELRMLFLPSRRLHRRSLGAAASELLRGALAMVVGGAYRGMALLLAGRHQRAEYRADAVAVRVAGRDQVIAMLGTLELSTSCAYAIERARARGSDEDAATIVRRHVAAMPEREKERLRRVAARRGSSVDDSHPPTPLRIDWIAQLPAADPQVRMAAGESEAVERELRAAWARRRR